MATPRFPMLAHAFAAALALALASPGLAQTTTDVPADAATGDGLNMGTEVASGQAIGDTYVAGKFGSWEQRCVRTEGGIDPCQLYILLKDKDGNSVAEFTMFSLPKGTTGPAVAGATFIAPLETLLTAGMGMQIGTGPVKAYPFNVCTQIGCVARLGFTAEEVEALRKGSDAKMIIVPFVAPDERVELTMSLTGFTDGLAAVDAANAAADAAAAAAAPADGAAPAATGDAPAP
jgi:invasion protein IalB